MHPVTFGLGMFAQALEGMMRNSLTPELSALLGVVIRFFLAQWGLTSKDFEQLDHVLTHIDQNQMLHVLQEYKHSFLDFIQADAARREMWMVQLTMLLALQNRLSGQEISHGQASYLWSLGNHFRFTNEQVIQLIAQADLQAKFLTQCILQGMVVVMDTLNNKMKEGGRW